MRTLLTKVAFPLLLMLPLLMKAQSPLDDYISGGLKDNIVLQQKNISLESALTSLSIARGMFLPSVSLQGQYLDGNGGRDISIPVGDLLNPVYASLNALTNSQEFPQISNVSEDFLPHNFYDAKVHVTMPIVNSDLLYNNKIRQQQVVLAQYELDVYKRELIKNIKTAYYNYLSAQAAVAIYQSALDRAKEGKRVNEALLSNGKGLPAYVLRAESEVVTIEANITEAQNQAENAGLYFNFLLNRDADAPIIASDITSINISALDTLLNVSVNEREELAQMREAVELRQSMVKMDQLFWTPRLNGFVDLGSQYSDWKFNSQSRYSLIGLQLEIPLFAGLTNRGKTKLAQYEAQNTELGMQQVTQQLTIGEATARNGVVTAYHNYEAAIKQLDAAASYQRLIEKGYRDGVNSFIETVDARSQLTQAQLQSNVAKYRVLIAQAAYERETASYPLPQ